METYVIFRRSGWSTVAELREATERSASEGDQMPEDISRVRSYLLSEPTGKLGTVCVFQASSPEAVRAHAARAGLPIDEIVKVADTVIVRPDPVPATT